MNRTPWKRWAALVLALTLTAAACGGRDDSSSDDSGDGGSGSETTEAGETAFIDPANDCTDYQGTDGRHRRHDQGRHRPARSPVRTSIYDQVTNGIEAYFKAVNEAGGITAGDGKTYKIELVKENDEYDPAKTPPLVKKLVEQDQVFAIVGVIGTENNVASATT